MNSLIAILAQLTIAVTPPAGTVADIYIAGSFNQWDPAAPGYRLKQSGSQYTITLPDSVRGPIEYKFTMGSWDSVETDATGADIPNRRFDIPAVGAVTLNLGIAGWRDPSKPRRMRPSATKSVSILNDSFAIPQLRTTRRVWLYLPPDYATSKKRYAVLYMHDGQNVFDAATSYVGEWGVDETLDSLHAAGDPGVIVVAVDHAGERRFHEYSPWVNARYGGGDGDEYVDFLVNTLKPYIDRHYRTLPDRANTAIAGSSMGGLISYYAALKYPDVFGMAGVFSPAFWIAPEIVAFTKSASMAVRPRMYMISAKNEASIPRQLVVSVPLMHELAAKGYAAETDLLSAIIADGAHSEWFWRREFPAAYRWLFRR